MPNAVAGRAAGYSLRKVIDRVPVIDVDAEGIIPSEAMKVKLHFHTTFDHLSNLSCTMCNRHECTCSRTAIFFSTGQGI
jgi:hypothetical protein